MSRIAAVLYKEFLQIRRDRMTLALVFLIPLVQLLLFGYAIQTEVRHVPTVVFDQSLSPESRDLLQSFVASGYFDVVEAAGSYHEVNKTIDSGEAQVGIIFPPDFARCLKRGESGTVQVIVDASDNMVANQAVAVANAELHTNLERLHADLLSAYDATIEGWARALEMRDVDTEHHCLRVAERAVELAACFDYSAQKLVWFRRGALLHDIGKIAIPDAILNKPGPLDEAEWELMRQHPRIAIELLRNIKFLEPSLDIPGFHHERWDGSGYPFGLHAAEIPEAARIFAVADVYDALTSDRPYRKAWGEREALHYIATQAGRHFDPAVVHTFRALMKEKGVHL